MKLRVFMKYLPSRRRCLRLERLLKITVLHTHHTVVASNQTLTWTPSWSKRVCVQWEKRKVVVVIILKAHLRSQCKQHNGKKFCPQSAKNLKIILKNICMIAMSKSQYISSLKILKRLRNARHLIQLSDMKTHGIQELSNSALPKNTSQAVKR